MNWTPGLSWLAALRARRAAHKAAKDGADMGTAFGLDASMTGPLDLDTVRPGPPPTATALERRLVRRSGL
jgi:hypothetical protein